MIARISGKIVEKKEQSLVIDVHGLYYEIVVPSSVFERIEETKDAEGNVHLVTYHYLQLTPSSGVPVLIGFLNEIEKDFFLQFITVSGIGPRAAVKALNKPISEISRAIDEEDVAFLKTLPGIGAQRAKEIVAKLQGKVGKFGLIQDKSEKSYEAPKPDWQEEALSVLLQLQYRRPEALEMIKKALERSAHIRSTEELLNEIYRQRVKS
jgi:Holliday junction DNA helicase RuvA